MILLSCNPYRFIYEIHIILVSDLGFFFFFNVKQMRWRNHLLDSHFCFPQRDASSLPLTRGFIFKVHLQGLCEAPAAVK